LSPVTWSIVVAELLEQPLRLSGETGVNLRNEGRVGQVLIDGISDIDRWTDIHDRVVLSGIAPQSDHLAFAIVQRRLGIQVVLDELPVGVANCGDLPVPIVRNRDRDRVRSVGVEVLVPVRARREVTGAYTGYLSQQFEEPHEREGLSRRRARLSGTRTRSGTNSRSSTIAWWGCPYRPRSPRRSPWSPVLTRVVSSHRSFSRRGSIDATRRSTYSRAASDISSYCGWTT